MFVVFRERTRKKEYVSIHRRNVRNEIRTRVLDDVKCEDVTYRAAGGKISIDYPAQGNPYYSIVVWQPTALIR